ncbi:MAG: hypothetical protein K8T20_01025 [Planctomycetes bacterium]|nr:hypothetical protein [Planctomycetota bacterium]
MTDELREFLIEMVELGGVVIVVGAGIVYGLRKAFRYTDAFERETPVAKPPQVEPPRTMFPEKGSTASPPQNPPDPGAPGPIVRSNRLM